MRPKFETKLAKKFWHKLVARPELAFSFLLLLLVFFLLSGQGFYPRLVISPKKAAIPTPIELPQPAPYPLNVTGKPAPVLTAKSAVVIDGVSRVVLLAKSENARLLPASTTKVMTALVALETYKPDDVFEVKEVGVEGTTMDLVSGEKITVENLLYGLLVASANDAAEVLASAYPGGREAFIAQMNQKAVQLRMLNTHFVNPTGIDAPGHFTTVADLTLLASEAVKNPLFSQIVSSKEITVTDVSGETAHELTNINELLGEVEGILGGKTGWTEAAGECLVTITEREGNRIITAVLGSQDRFGETKALIEWAFANHRWEPS